ncbi:MAG: amidohydrolase family protein [Candidatus Hodarchaeales archaeon]|jgi:cytosine/adenosine deaminase-related metal-dependent hydrolase
MTNDKGSGNLEAGSNTSPDQQIAFFHVNVVPMDAERILADQTVIIRNDRIVAVGPSETTTIPNDVMTIEGQGKYLMPGLADMHVHMHFPQDLTLFIANGVTTVRNMWGTPRHVAWRERIAKSELLGPTIYTAGPLLDGKPYWSGSFVIETPDEVEEIVAEHKRVGYDFLKTYSHLSKSVYNRLIEVAAEYGLPVAGHVPTEEPRSADMYVIKIDANGLAQWNHTIRCFFGAIDDGRASSLQRTT